MSQIKSWKSSQWKEEDAKRRPFINRRLFGAINLQDYRKLYLYLSVGYDVNYRGYDYRFLNSMDKDTKKRLQEWVCGPLVSTISGIAPLHLAVIRKDMKTANILLEMGAKVDIRSARKVTPLHLASILGYEEMVRLLMDKGCDINAKTCQEKTALYFAIHSGFYKIAILLISKFADFSGIDLNQVLYKPGFLQLVVSLNFSRYCTNIPRLMQYMERYFTTRGTTDSLHVEWLWLKDWWKRQAFGMFSLRKIAAIDVRRVYGLETKALIEKYNFPDFVRSNLIHGNGVSV